MGGIGIGITSQTSPSAAATALTNLPQSVVNEIASKLKITAPTSVAALTTALATGTMGLPENVAVKLTRISTPAFYGTIKKLPGNAGYEFTFQGQTITIPA